MSFWISFVRTDSSLKLPNGVWLLEEVQVSYFAGCRYDHDGVLFLRQKQTTECRSRAAPEAHRFWSFSSTSCHSIRSAQSIAFDSKSQQPSPANVSTFAAHHRKFPQCSRKRSETVKAFLVGKNCNFEQSDEEAVGGSPIGASPA